MENLIVKLLKTRRTLTIITAIITDLITNSDWQNTTKELMQLFAKTLAHLIRQWTTDRNKKRIKVKIQCLCRCMSIELELNLKFSIGVE